MVKEIDTKDLRKKIRYCFVEFKDDIENNRRYSASEWERTAAERIRLAFALNLMTKSTCSRYLYLIREKLYFIV